MAAQPQRRQIERIPKSRGHKYIFMRLQAVNLLNDHYNGKAFIIFFFLLPAKFNANLCNNEMWRWCSYIVLAIDNENSLIHSCSLSIARNSFKILSAQMFISFCTNSARTYGVVIYLS